MRAKRVFSILLAAVLALSLLPSAALAEGDGPAGTGWTLLTDAVSSDITSTTNYYLEGDVVLSGSITAVGADVEVTIDLRGHKLSTASGAVLKTRVNGTLTILDTEGGGSIEQKNAIQPQGGTVNIRGGTINGLSQSAIKTSSSTTVNISGGALISTGSSDATVYMKGGELHVSGGSIGGGARYAIELENSASLYLSGVPEITGTTSGQSTGAEIFIDGSSGSAKSISNTIYAADDSTPYTGELLNIALPSMKSYWGFSENDEDVTIVQSVSVANYDKFALLGIPEGKGLNFDDTAGTLVYGDYVPYVPKHTHGVDGGTGDIEWTKWDGTTDLEAGNYYIENNITLSKTINVSGPVNLCLNGKTISYSGSSSNKHAFSVKGSFTVCDCKGGGEIQQLSNSTARYYTIEVKAYATFNLYGGTITAAGNSVAVHTVQPGTINVYGGSIEGTTYQGAITSSGGEVTIAGGSVSKIWMQGTELYLTGAPVIGSVYLNKNENVQIPNKVYAAKEEENYSGGNVTISTNEQNIVSGTVIVHDVSDSNADKFTFTGYELEKVDNDLVVKDPDTPTGHKHAVDGSAGTQTWTEWDGKTNLTAAGYYYLAENAEPTAAIEVTADVHLCLNGKTISRTSGNEVFSVTGKLTICDCEGGGEVSISGSIYRAAVRLESSGSLTLYSGTLDGGSGNGVFASGANTEVTIAGGTVSGTRSGGALGVSGGTATITGGTVNGVKLQNRAELYLGGAPDVGTVSMAKSGTAKGYDNQIFAAADGTAYAGDKITLTSDDDNIPENTVIVRSVNDDNKGLFELTDYALEKSGDNLVIKAASAIELSVTVPSGLTYGDTKPLTITVEPADAALAFAFAGQSPNDNGSDKFSVTKGSDGTYSLYAGAVGNFILTVTATADGYNQKEVTVEFTVGKAALTVTADNVTVAYGEPKPEFTAQINGFVNDDYEGDLTGTLEFDCAYAAGSPVGTYPITPKGLTSNNYSISFVDGTLTVTENAVPMPTAPVGKTLTYNSGLQDLIIPGSAEHGTMYYSLSQNGPWYTAVPQAKDAGVYTVWYKVVGDPGYSDTAPNSVTAVINKAPLTIKALDRRAYVGERMPAFAYDVVGLLGSDTLDKAPSFSCNANMNMPGTYVIRIFGAEAANYDISYVNGILTVEHRFVIPGYKITVVVVGKGEASASAGWADAGSVISVISKADAGYTLGSITVETESGRSVAMKDGKFTMPNDSVVVTVTFEKKGEPFYDVRPGDWFYDAVIWAYENGIMDGMDIGWFQPDGTVSRAMAVTVLYRMEGQPAVSGSSGFTDVVSGSWYDDAVTWASKNGIVLGVTEDTYRPNDPVTREQLAAILFRYADYKGYDRSASADLTGYADYAEVSAYAVPALRWACGCGIIDGSAGKLDPRSGATRAQLATMLMRFDKAAK